LPLAGWFGRTLLEGAPRAGVGARRALLGLTAALYIAALSSFWPLITREDFLPYEPLVAIVLTPVLLATLRPREQAVAGSRRLALAACAAPLLLACLEITLVVLKEPPWQDHTQPQTRLLA